MSSARRTRPASTFAGTPRRRTVRSLRSPASICSFPSVQTDSIGGMMSISKAICLGQGPLQEAGPPRFRRVQPGSLVVCRLRSSGRSSPRRTGAAGTMMPAVTCGGISSSPGRWRRESSFVLVPAGCSCRRQCRRQPSRTAILNFTTAEPPLNMSVRRIDPDTIVNDSSSPKTSSCKTIARWSFIIASPAICRSSITTATCRRGRSPKTTASPTSRKSGSTATITSGGRCAPRASRSATARATPADWEKFQKWAEVVPRTLRNPLYHWTHLELKRPLGISDRLLNPQTARSIWDDCNAALARDDMSCRGILRQMRVEVVCTTDDPPDSLEHHAADRRRRGVSGSACCRPSGPTAHWPSTSPEAFNHYVDRLAEVAGIDIGDALPCYLDALRRRHDFFHRCRLPAFRPWPGDVRRRRRHDRWRRRAFSRGSAAARRRRAEEAARFRSAMLHEMALWDHERGWTQQFHIGALRNNNSRMFADVGPDAGFDSIADGPYARGLARFLDRLDRHEPVGQDDPLQSQSRARTRCWRR